VKVFRDEGCEARGEEMRAASRGVLFVYTPLAWHEER
jgi:hypothetical protein